jgi:putative membrane protein
MMRYWGYGPSYSSFGFGGIFVIIWWILVAWLIFALLRFLLGGHRHWHERHGLPENDTDEALKILKQRYARGEISKKEFDAIKKDIA